MSTRITRAISEADRRGAAGQPIDWDWHSIPGSDLMPAFPASGRRLESDSLGALLGEALPDPADPGR